MFETDTRECARYTLGLFFFKVPIGPRCQIRRKTSTFFKGKFWTRVTACGFTVHQAERARLAHCDELRALSRRKCTFFTRIYGVRFQWPARTWGGELDHNLVRVNIEHSQYVQSPVPVYTHSQKSNTESWDQVCYRYTFNIRKTAKKDQRPTTVYRFSQVYVWGLRVVDVSFTLALENTMESVLESSSPRGPLLSLSRECVGTLHSPNRGLETELQSFGKVCKFRPLDAGLDRKAAPLQLELQRRGRFLQRPSNSERDWVETGVWALGSWRELESATLARS